jgi:hypothetical protein
MVVELGHSRLVTPSRRGDELDMTFNSMRVLEVWLSFPLLRAN